MNENLNTLHAAIIDHSYHKKTGSSKFFHDFIESFYITTIYWDDSWNNGSGININEINNRNYDVIFFFQIILDIEEYRRLKCKKIVIIPMYDAVVNKSKEFWIKYRKYIFISYSKKLHQTFIDLGMVSYYIQYFPDITESKLIQRTSDKAFFWYRTTDISPIIVNKLLAKNHKIGLIVHNSPDPGFKPIKEDEFTDFSSVEVTSWYSDKSDYDSKIKECTVYLAPRLLEGIGFSFLEAMAAGCCVIAPNLPTMNEYIIDGLTGILFDPKEPFSIDENFNFKALGYNAREYIIKGFYDYIVRRKLVVEAIEEYIHYERAKSKLKIGTIVPIVKNSIDVSYHIIAKLVKTAMRLIVK